MGVKVTVTLDGWQFGPPKPGLQATPQVPFTHVADAFAFAAAGQTVPHTPQLLTSVRRLTSQPFAALPSQSA